MPASQKTATLRIGNCLVVLTIAVVFSFGCGRGNQHESLPATMAPPSPAQTFRSSAEKQPIAVTPALAEVNEAIQRVCANAVEIDAARTTPFITGDFNGDGAQDLAVVVRPVKGTLSKLNGEYANWILEDPHKIILPDPNKAVQELPKPLARETVRPDDILLLILHGYGEKGWHHPYARQTFLLKNSVGDHLRAESSDKVNDGNRQAGDLIREKLANEDGFLYWTQGKYAWRH